MSQMLHWVKKLDYTCYWESEISNVCNAVEDHCLQAMKIVHHHANGCFDWSISGQQSVSPSREAISILSGKYKRVTVVHPVVPVALDGMNSLKWIMNTHVKAIVCRDFSRMLIYRLHLRQQTLDEANYGWNYTNYVKEFWFCRIFTQGQGHISKLHTHKVRPPLLEL